MTDEQLNKAMKMKGRTVYLVHGFNVKDGGAGSVMKLKLALQAKGFNVKNINYNWTFLLGVRMCNKKIAHVIESMSDENSIAIGHSNGCALIHHAAQYGAPFSDVVYINPALNSDAELAPQVKKAQVWHAGGDKVVWFSKFIPAHTWGDMGKKGYNGDDERYQNIDAEKFTGEKLDHNDIFTNHHVKRLVEKIIFNLNGGS